MTASRASAVSWTTADASGPAGTRGRWYQIDKSGEPWVVDTRGHPQFLEWGGRQGNAIRKRDIAHALAACGGWVDLILCVAVDPGQKPRRIRHARHWPQRCGWLDPDAFDSDTGMFRLELRPASELPG